MKMYKTVKWSNEITESEILRTTDKFVYRKTERGEDRQVITSSYHAWHKSKEEAIEHLQNRYLSIIEYAKKSIADAERNLAEVDQLKK